MAAETKRPCPIPWAQSQEGSLRIETTMGTVRLPNTDGPCTSDQAQTSTNLRETLCQRDCSKFLRVLMQWRQEYGAWPSGWNEYFMPYFYTVWDEWRMNVTFMTAIHELLKDICRDPGPVRRPRAKPPDKPREGDGQVRDGSQRCLQNVQQAEQCISRQDLAGALSALCAAVRDIAEPKQERGS